MRLVQALPSTASTIFMTPLRRPTPAVAGLLRAGMSPLLALDQARAATVGDDARHDATPP
jgi:hypothetical protein